MRYPASRYAPFLLALALPLALSCPARAQNRRVAIIVDTSGSMTHNDKARFAVLGAKLMADILDSGDRLSVIKIPMQQSSCEDGPTPSLSRNFSGASRASFKRGLDAFLKYEGPYDAFAAPVNNAISFLKRGGSSRLLLLLADAGGFTCPREQAAKLTRLQRSGVIVAAINLGSTSGAFTGNPPFSYSSYARSSGQVLLRLAKIYQRMLGSRRVQSGKVSGGTVRVTISPYIKQAYLVVAGDGDIQPLSSASSNPGAASVDNNYRGGGRVAGLDGKVRSYRLVHLTGPKAGPWTFTASGLGSSASYMLLQETSIRPRLIARPYTTSGESRIEVELIDENTGKRITDPSRIPDLRVTVRLGGRKVTFQDDGGGGDRKAGDGVFTTRHRFKKKGKRPLRVRVSTRDSNRSTALTADVKDISWVLRPRTPSRVLAGQAAKLLVDVAPVAPGVPLVDLPAEINADWGAGSTVLRDDGKGGDATAGDRQFTGSWTPMQVGKKTLTFRAKRGKASQRTSADVEVLGKIKFAAPRPVKLGEVGSGQTRSGQLDLTDAQVWGTFKLEVDSKFDSAGTALELDTGGGWQLVGKGPLTVTLSKGGQLTWPVRARVGPCPAGLKPSQSPSFLLSTKDPEGKPLSHEVPIILTVKKDPWLTCYWYIPATIISAALLLFIIYGYIWPFSFPGRSGIVISPEEDTSEGFFYPIRRARGTRRKFYRHATAYICSDYRISGKARGAILRLRAQRQGIYMEPLPGYTVERLNMDDEWEAIPATMQRCRSGVTYRYEPGSLYFEFRSKG